MNSAKDTQKDPVLKNKLLYFRELGKNNRNEVKD